MEWRRLLPEKFVLPQRDAHDAPGPHQAAQRSANTQRASSPQHLSAPQRASSASPASHAPSGSSSDKTEDTGPERSLFFDNFGKTGETIEEQIGLLKSRFIDLQALRDDFDTLSLPVLESLKGHAAAQSRLAETEALFDQMRKENQRLRTEALSMRKTCDQLSMERSQAVRAERARQESVKSLEERIASLQHELDQKYSAVNLLECQIKAESFKSGSLDDLNGSLKRDLEAALDKIAGMQQDAVELHDASALDRAEIARLNETLERLLPAHTAAKRQLAELESHLQQVNRTLSALETRHVAEMAARQESDEGRKQDRLILEEEISFLVTQNEAVAGRHAATEKLLEQARAAIAAKHDELQAADRSVKASALDLTSIKRKHAKSQDELGRLEHQVEATDKLLQEAKGRNSMLVKALAGKDEQIAQNNAQVESLTQQVDALEGQFEQKRAALEAENNKLIEELESAKAESALAQGALTIARASREKLMEQINFLKRSQSRMMEVSAGDKAEKPRLKEAIINQKNSNVRPLRSPEQDSR